MKVSSVIILTFLTLACITFLFSFVSQTLSLNPAYDNTSIGKISNLTKTNYEMTTENLGSFKSEFENKLQEKPEGVNAIALYLGFSVQFVFDFVKIMFSVITLPITLIQIIIVSVFLADFPVEVQNIFSTIFAIIQVIFGVWICFKLATIIMGRDL